MTRWSFAPDTLYRIADLSVRERLGDHLLDQGLQVMGTLAFGGISHHQQDGQVRIILGNLEREGDIVKLWHHDIGQQQVEGAGLDSAQRLLARLPP